MRAIRTALAVALVFVVGASLAWAADETCAPTKIPLPAGSITTCSTESGSTTTIQWDALVQADAVVTSSEAGEIVTFRTYSPGHESVGEITLRGGMTRNRDALKAWGAAALTPAQTLGPSRELRVWWDVDTKKKNVRKSVGATLRPKKDDEEGE